MYISDWDREGWEDERFMIFCMRMFTPQNIDIIVRNILQMDRSKKLTLNASHSKLAKALWQSKRLNTQKQKENLQLQTKVKHLNSRSNKRPAMQGNRVEEKYQKLIVKVNEQARWIKETTVMIEERRYEEMREEVNRLEARLTAVTQRAIDSDKKLKRFTKKVEKQQQPFDKLKEKTEEQQLVQDLQKDSHQIQALFHSKSTYLKQLQSRNKTTNLEILQLLSIKNKLRSQPRLSNTPKPSMTLQ